MSPEKGVLRGAIQSLIVSAIQSSIEYAFEDQYEKWKVSRLFKTEGHMSYLRQGRAMSEH